AATGCNSAYLYTPNLNQGGTQADYHARMFAPGDGIAEDPATGSASAILAAQFLASGTLANGETTITLLQGAQMGRPSQIRLRIIAQDGQLQQVCIAGSAVAIGQGQLHALPPA
ncbi:MAG: PhzF family phenazine biosynthesis protein, partial [Rhodobacteraceae bacterium]|nr:PhzF family phenazine biosynthesis protein [Paracoccaceae bacterium]